MTPENDKRLRGIMDRSSLEELMPGFDKDAVWADITGRTQLPAKKAFNWRWVTHMGALAAGVLLAWVFLFRGSAPEGQTLKNAHHMRASIKRAMNKTSTPDTATVLAATKEQPGKQQKLRQSTKLLLPEPVIARPFAPEAPQQPDRATVATVPAPVKKPIRAVHLLDVNNEDRDIVLQPMPEQQGEPIAIQIIKATNGDAAPRYNNGPVAGRTLLRSLAITHSKN